MEKSQEHILYEGMSDAGRDASILSRKVVFKACGDKLQVGNNIKVKRSISVGQRRFWSGLGLHGVEENIYRYCNCDMIWEGMITFGIIILIFIEKYSN